MNTNKKIPENYVYKYPNFSSLKNIEYTQKIKIGDDEDKLICNLDFYLGDKDHEDPDSSTSCTISGCFEISSFNLNVYAKNDLVRGMPIDCAKRIFNRINNGFNKLSNEEKRKFINLMKED